MKRVLSYLACAIAFGCAMVRWEFSIGIRISIFEILSAVFLALFLVSAWHGGPIRLRRELKALLWIKWSYVLVIALSGIRLWATADPDALALFVKGLISETAYAAFFTALVLYLCRNTELRSRIWSAYIAGVVLSSIYGLVQSFAYKLWRVDIGDHLWTALSYGVRFTTAHDWEIQGFARGEGFPGVDAGATYAVTLLPMLLYQLSERRTRKTMASAGLIFLGLLVTMSRTGIVSFVVAAAVGAILERKRFMSIARAALLGIIPIALAAIVWWDLFSEVFQSRFGIDSTRVALNKSGLQLFFEHPLLGGGANTFSAVARDLPHTFFTDANLHDSWLTILVNLGLLGVLLEGAFLGYVIYQAIRTKSSQANVFAATVVGLCVGALFNQVLDAFYFNLFVILAFSLIILDSPRPGTGTKWQSPITEPSLETI